MSHRWNWSPRKKRETGVEKKNCFIITVKNEKTSHRLGENITKDISDLKKYQKLLKLNNKEKKILMCKISEQNYHQRWYTDGK